MTSPIDTTAALADITAFMQEAGELALKGQATVRSTMKEGEQIVTETDIAISKLAQQKLAHWFSRPGHILLDEESIENAGTPEEVFTKTEYQWALDPIDGTAGYAMGRNLWGISLGLLHKGRPFLGAFYLPAIQQLLATDGTQSWVIHNAFTTSEIKTPLHSKAMSLNSQVFVETYCAAHLGWNERTGNVIWINTPESAMDGSMNALTNHAAGHVLINFYSVWDVAAAIAIGLNAGFAVRNMDNGQSFSAFTASDFKPNWKLRENWLLCPVEHFDYLNKAIKGE